MSVEGDEELMVRVQRGDRRAYEELYARFRLPIFRFLHRRTGSPSAAEEAHQETWLRVYRHRDRYNPALRFRSWLFAIAANCGRDAYRPGEVADEAPELVLEPDEPSDLRVRLLEALSRLDPEDRSLLLLAAEGFDGPEIASMLGIGAGAARMRLSRARQRIRAAVGGTDA